MKQNGLKKGYIRRKKFEIYEKKSGGWRYFCGCTVRCLYCHNPDTWKMNVGELKSVDEIVAKALRYKNYWGKEGGVTVSGRDIFNWNGYGGKDGGMYASDSC